MKQTDWRLMIIDGVPAIEWLDDLLQAYEVRDARLDEMTTLWDQLCLLIDSMVEVMQHDSPPRAPELAKRLTEG